jgi:Tfp pilus assembly protein PilV
VSVFAETLQTKATARRPLALRKGRRGFTLVEALITTVLTTMVCGGLFAVGIAAHRSAEHSRVATEARALAKQRVEEIMATGLTGLKQPSCTAMKGDTNYSAMGYKIVRKPRMIWHAASGSVTQSQHAAYAETHVDVVHVSPLFKRTVTNTYSVIISE